MPDRDRIAARLDALWEIARGPGGGADRPAFSPAEAQAMELVAGWAREAGLEPAIDAAGNLWALPAGLGPTHPIVTAGSHVDTVPDGGRYDGALGTVLGLEIADALRDGTTAGARAGLLVCTAEEAPRFGAGTVGSRLMVGTLAPAALADLTDDAGVSAAQAQTEFLGALSALPRIDPPLARLRGHVEIHVAQRQALRTLGIVTRVASPRRFQITIEGQSGHSGEVSMEERHDALAGAAEVILGIEAAARAQPAETVATVGTISVAPGAVSVIPGVARLGVDVRGIDSDSLARLDADIHRIVHEVADERGVQSAVALTRAGEPVTMSQELAAAALTAARELGIAAAETWSGAGHDAQHLAAVAPTLLLFVPLHGGESHTPQEGADMDEIVQAANLGARVLRDLALDTGVGV